MKKPINFEYGFIVLDQGDSGLIYVRPESISYVIPVTENSCVIGIDNTWFVDQRPVVSHSAKQVIVAINEAKVNPSSIL